MNKKTPVLLILYVVAFQWFTIPLNAQQTPHYKITHWTTDEGLPTNTLIHLYQDKADYLWIGSYDGLIRFDGTRFIAYDKSNAANLVSFHARVLTGDEEGNLWIGTGSGLVLHKQGKFTDLSNKNYSFFMESIFLDKATNKIWLGTRDSGVFLYDIASNKYEQLKNNFSKDLINAITKDAAGGFWIGAEKNGLGYYFDGRWSYYNQQHGLLNTEIICLYLDENQELYIGTTSGLYKKDGQRFINVEKFNGIRINRIKKDAEGNLWVLTADGIYGQHEKSEWWHIGKEEGLSNNDVRDLIFDSEGSIWAATYRGGLNHLMKTPFKTFSANEGLQAEAIGAFEQLTDTKFMVGTTEGKLFAIENGVVSPFQIKTPIKQRIYDFLYDHKKNLWVVSYDGLLLITPDGREKLFTEKDGLSTNQIRIIYQDKKNNYLIGTRTHGLLKMEFTEFPFRPDFQKYKYDELTQLNSTFIMSIEEDRKGNLLIGSNTGGLNILSVDGSIQNYSKNKGLISNVTYSVRADKENVLWIATSEGLCRLENDQLINYSKKDGLPIESVFDAVEDNKGYLWMPTAKGIVRVRKKQLKEYTEKKIDKIDWKVFNNKDELERSECTGATHMAVGKDSSLWFMMLRGIVNVNPAHVIRNERRPSVYIEKVIVDDKELEIRENIIIAPEHQRIAFNYIGISLLYPRTVKYKYKLENFDKDWVDAGTELQAIYTNLRHGTYTFSVIACNNDGVWSSAGSTVSFVVDPYYYQTWWFYLLVGAAFSTGLFGYVRWRTRELKRESVMLEQKIEERTKLIAEQRDEMAVLYEELRANQEEIMAQRDDLAEKNEEIASINTNLESIVAERTRSLEDQNKRLSEYAFINAHQLRAPLASILGLINLFKSDTPMQEQHELLDLLKKSSVELDQIVRSISRMLEGMEESKDKEKEKELP